MKCCCLFILNWLMVSVLLLAFLENNTDAQKGEFYLNKVLHEKKKF